MSVHKRSWRYAVGPLLALALTLTACNSDEEEPTGDASAPQEQEGQEETSEGDEAAPADGEGGSDEQLSGGDGGGEPIDDFITVAVGESPGPVMFEDTEGDDVYFDATVERVESGSWEDLAGSGLVAEDYPGFDPLYVEMSLTNENDPYEGPDPSFLLQVRSDDGGPFDPVDAAMAENLPEWCLAPPTETLWDFQSGDTRTTCQVFLVGHGLTVTSVDWPLAFGAVRWLTQS
ncbi:hypothetical protein [Streptomyces mayteni]